jgi:hypothetical protein
LRKERGIKQNDLLCNTKAIILKTEYLPVL